MTNRQEAQKSVRSTQHGAEPMVDFDDNLPLQRSFVERNIGQLVGIFQLDRLELHDRTEVTSLATGSMMGLVAVADGGKLSETAFNLWTIASQWFNEAGCPDSNRLDFTLGAIARRMWGENGRSAERRKRIANALTELMRTRVVVVGVNPYTLEPAEGAVWELHLLEAAGIQAEWHLVMEAARKGDRDALSSLASLGAHRGEQPGEDRSTWSMVLPKWLADSVRRDHGVVLDYEIQRALRGSAKRIWVQLESHFGWDRLELAAREDVTELLEQLDAATPTLFEELLPAAETPTVELERLTVPLTAETYEAFGITHRNRKRDLEAACASIVANDRTYLRAEVQNVPGSKRNFELRLVRAAGPLRQERLRLGMGERIKSRTVPA
ncbi:MAG: hypothetical protein ACR2J6_06310 [Thermoleophilaceae bacterium]